MQTFLPYPDFVASAAALDPRRLGKQRVEALQVLRALVFPTYGWKNHPAVAMWRGFVPALALYSVAVCRQWTSMGFADTVLPQVLEFTGGRVPDPADLAGRGMLPPWLGEPAVHLSHQSSLLRKDPAHYRPLFGPDLPDDLPYTWPASVFPRWPLRRDSTEGMPLPEAEAVTGLHLDPGPETEALTRLLNGRDADLPGSDRVRLAGVALLAGLCAPGRTAWISPTTTPRLDLVPHPEPTLDPEPAPHPQTTPTIPPEARTAMSTEATANPEFLFFRADHPPDHLPADVGLVVLDHVEGHWPSPVLRLRHGT